jgi:Fe-S-cluster-containing dehydrogenase component/formate-dependent nitrite reductase membrane component NrfD
MRYGFILDQRKCIGCHACTVACKQENAVALGDFRTWVKYTESGRFPHVRRSFLVERCNHCDDAPCVQICPVTALWRRDDGIIDFSGDRCIGCKACMAACPYDAIYIDPDTHTIGKCHYCAHRVDVGLQPACVNVCPVEAIITGDLDDPSSRISQLLSVEPGVVRRPEKGTKPKVFYLGADEAAIVPETTSERSTYLWGEPDLDKPIRLGEPLGYAPSAEIRREYAVHHRRPWGWHVAAYLWTKSIAAGAMLVAALLFLLGGVTNEHELLTRVAPLLALAFLAVTDALLVLDLERPERFWRVMLWPHWRSWLVLGAYILAAFGTVVIAELAAALAGAAGATRILLWAAAILAGAAAAYTAFLFAQARGRDLWQNPLLPVVLVVQAFAAGAAGLAILAVPLDRAAVPRLAAVLAVAAGILVVLVLFEVALPPVTAHARLALAHMTEGSNRLRFWGGVVLLGLLVPCGIAAWVAAGGPAGVALVAAVLALAGLAVYEDGYVRAGQSVPQS